MKILISNDDGILAPGLAALYWAVADMGDVTIVAPDSPQSAAGHSITLSHPLTVREVKIDSPKPLVGTSVDGRPADCVRLAIRNLMSEPPELVLSGINAGANVGINVFYSGTVAAAAEAAMCDIPAVAFSATMTSGEVDFERAAKLCRWTLEKLLSAGLCRGDLVNVNIPPLGPGLPKGIHVVPQSTAEVNDVYSQETTHTGSEMYRLSDDYDFAPGQKDCDIVSISEGYITVTPLHVDMTQHKRLKNFEKFDWGKLPG